MASAPEHPLLSFFGLRQSAQQTAPTHFPTGKSGSTSHEVDRESLMDRFEVFGSHTFAEVVAEVRCRTLYRYWGYREHVEDAVSVAALTLLEYWIPRLATEDGARNFQYAVRYGCFRASTHLLNEMDTESHHVPIDDDEGNFRAEVQALADITPGPEEVVCGEELVRTVRELVDELDWYNCFTEETTRKEAARRGVSQMKVVRARAKSRACVKRALESSVA